MPFDPSKDKMLKQWKCQETGLVVSINQYGEGEPKVQIGPRILLKKDGSERAAIGTCNMGIIMGMSLSDKLKSYDEQDRNKLQVATEMLKTGDTILLTKDTTLASMLQDINNVVNYKKKETKDSENSTVISYYDFGKRAFRSFDRDRLTDPSLPF